MRLPSTEETKTTRGPFFKSANFGWCQRGQVVFSNGTKGRIVGTRNGIDIVAWEGSTAGAFRRMCFMFDRDARASK